MSSSGMVEFGIDELISDDVRISPHNGRQREVIRTTPGLGPIVAALTSDVGRCGMTSFGFEWADADANVRKHRRPVVVVARFGLPEGDPPRSPRPSPPR